MSELVRVELGTRSYAIHIAPGLIAQAGELMKPLLRAPRTFIVTDGTVAPLYLQDLQASLDQTNISHDVLTVPAGEGSKSFATFEKVVESLLENKVERTTTLIALGGGVIGDLCGFAAAVALRGIDFVQIPTTLLAQVDSAVGGKTGINTRHGKNLVGSFHQPRLVLCDVDTLATLPRRQLLAGYAEVVKYGLINDAAFFGWLEENGANLLAGDMQSLGTAVAHCCRAKAVIVGADERESGERALLNLGHTFAHALEAEAGYGDRLLHGEAVAIGLCWAFDLSARLGLCPAADASRVRAHLASVGLPQRPPICADLTWSTARLMAHMQRDKKVHAGRPTFVLARSIGQAFLTDDVPVTALSDVPTAALDAD